MGLIFQTNLEIHKIHWNVFVSLNRNKLTNMLVRLRNE